MTSEFTLAPTEKFFKENNYFGLEPSNVNMFEQRMIPAVSFDGKILLQGKGKIAMAPGRHPSTSLIQHLNATHLYSAPLMVYDDFQNSRPSVRWKWWSVPGISGQQGAGGHGGERS